MFIINPYRYASGGGGSFYQYASWDSANADIVDAGGYHLSGTFTVPAAWNGRKVRAMMGSQESATAHAASMSLNGSTFNGQGSGSWANVVGVNDGGTPWSAPVIVSTGDQFTFSGGSVSAGTWRCVEVLANGVKGALVNRVTSGFSVGTAVTIVQWNNEVYDTDGYHDNSTNPSRLTIDAGTSGLVRLQANVKLSAAQSQIGLQLYKGGSTIQEIRSESVDEVLNLVSPPMPVTSTQYFEVGVYCSVATTVIVSPESWFAIEELPASLKYAIATAGSNLTITNGVGFVSMSPSTETTDVGNWYTAGQDHFTVPSGITRVRVGFCGQSTTGIPSGCEVAIFKNGSDIALSPHSSQVSSGDEFYHAVSGIIECTPGDTFEFKAKTSAGSQTLSAGSFFWIEEVPAVTS